MKIHYDTPEEQAWLEKILGRAVMATDALYDHAALRMDGKLDLKESVLLNLSIRAKIFEFLEQADFNEESGTHAFIRKKLDEPFVEKTNN